jgi:peptidoglycan/xylan/chitin deacetylase (PgdA/CDA1 family)
MRLLILMYHRARADRHGNAPEMLDAHFAHIATHYACVLPGGPLDPRRLNVCLTFDDAYADFHAVVFPLLQQHGLQAVLAVPPMVVREEAAVFAAVRPGPDSGVNRAEADDDFCTWQEISEMAQSGQVALAAHGLTHRRLDRAGTDLHTEIVLPQALLAARTGQPVESFVFPYGRFNRAALQRVRQCYRHVFRIGGADNPGWNSSLLYRVNADAMSAPDAPFSPTRRAGYRARYLWNRLRRR